MAACLAVVGYVVSGQLWAHCAEAQKLTCVLTEAVLPSGVFLGKTSKANVIIRETMSGTLKLTLHEHRIDI